MRSLANEILAKYGRSFGARLQVINDWSALYGGMIESNVQGSPYIGYNALLLSPQERDELAHLTESFGRIMTKALGAIVEAGPTTYRKLGWPELLDYALHYEPPNRYLTVAGRFDFGCDGAGGCHLMEYNSDTPSGPQEATPVEQKIFATLSRLAPVARLNPDTGGDMARAFYEEACFAPIPYGATESEGPRLLPRIGIIVQGRHITDMAQCEYYAARLRELGLECVVGDLLNLTLAGDGIFLLGQPIDALWRLYPIEYFARAPIFMAYTQANIMGHLKLLNNLRGFLAQSKAVLAWVWSQRQNPELFDQQEQEIIARHLPETYLLNDLPEDFDYSAYIIKEFYGREGAEVFDGAEMSREQWQQCRQWGTYVVQRRIDLAPVPHITSSEDGQAQLIEAFPCLGSYLVADRWGGCYSRLGARITTFQAQFVPTLLELER
jgi:glutathionylspermidine synthase